MSRIAILTAFLLVTLGAAAQNVPRFAKYAIGESGMFCYLPADPGGFELTLSEDGSAVYTGEVTHNDFNFAVIAINFKEPATGTNEEREELLISYLDFLQTQLGIQESAGYGKGHTLDSDESVIGVLDYWADDEGNDWVIKGWINEGHMAVMCLYGKGEYPYYSVQDMFLHGIRFSED